MEGLTFGWLTVLDPCPIYGGQPGPCLAFRRALSYANPHNFLMPHQCYSRLTTVDWPFRLHSQSNIWRLMAEERPRWEK